MLPDDLLLLIFTDLSTSTDSEEEDPERYSRPTRRPVAVTYLIACERVCRQWIQILSSPRAHRVWLDMHFRHFGEPRFISPSREVYVARFFHTYYSRAARSTLHDIDVFPDAASGNRAFDPSCTYKVFFEAHHKGASQLSPLIDVGKCRWDVPQASIFLFRRLQSHHHNPRDASRMQFHVMRHARDFPEYRSVVLDAETPSRSYYVPTPGLEGAVYLGRSDGARALLGRFDSTLIHRHSRDGSFTDDEGDTDHPNIYYAPTFVQPVVHNIFFGKVRYTLRIRVEVQYERKHPEKGGWLSDLELEMIPDGYPDTDVPFEKMSSSYVKDAFMKALDATLQWHLSDIVR